MGVWLKGTVNWERSQDFEDCEADALRTGQKPTPEPEPFAHYSALFARLCSRDLKGEYRNVRCP